MLFVSTCPTIKDSWTIAIWGFFNAAGWVVGKKIEIQNKPEDPKTNGKKD
jgi:hypothetical protein